MIVPASPERFDGIRDFAACLAAALGPGQQVQLVTTAGDAAPTPGTRTLARWSDLESLAPRPHTVYVHYLPTAWLSLAALRLLRTLGRLRARGTRVIVIAHEYQLDATGSPRRAAARVILGALVRAFASRADVFVTTHGFIADSARSDGLDRRCTIATIPIGSNIPGPVGDRTPAPAGSVVMFGQPAGMAPAPVAAAAALLARRGMTLVWICRREDEARSWLDRHAIPHTAVRIAAGLDHAEVAREISDAVIGFAPIIDGVSTRRTTVATLLQHGLPIAGTHGRATDTLYRESPAFALSAIEDGAAAAAALEQLLDDTQRRARMGAAARTLFDEHLAWPRIAAAYLRLAT